MIDINSKNIQVSIEALNSSASLIAWKQKDNYW